MFELENIFIENKIFDSAAKIFSFLINEYRFGGHMHATGAMAIVLTLGFIIGDSFNIDLLLIAYLVSLIVYSYDFYKGIEGDKLTNPERADFLEKKINYYPFIIGIYVTSLIVVIIYGNQSIIEMLVFFSILLGGGLLYGVLFKNFTKYIPAFKDVYVSLVWALGASFLLFIYNKQDLNMLIVLVFTFLFLKSLNTSIFNDLKDIKSDGKKGLKTIPVLIGFNNTITFTCLLSVITLIPLLFGVYYQVLPVYVLLFAIFTCYCIFYMFLTYKNQNNINWPQYHFFALLEKPIWPLVLIPLIWIMHT